MDVMAAGSMKLDKDGKNIYLIGDGNIVKVNIEKAENKNLMFIMSYFPKGTSAGNDLLFQSLAR